MVEFILVFEGLVGGLEGVRELRCLLGVALP